jgi:hypothetical protein
MSWLFFSNLVLITFPETTAATVVFSCTDRITPLEDEEIGTKTNGKVTKIMITIARMVR